MENGNATHEAGDGQSHPNDNADAFVNGNANMTYPTDDKNPLLGGSDPEVTSSRTCDTKCQGPAKYRLISVEPAMIFLVIAFGTMVNLKGMYIRQQIALKYGEHGDPGQSSSSCGQNMSNENDTDSKIQAEASEWNIYLSLTESIVSIFALTIFGAWSDRVGRRPVMLIPATGMVLQCLVNLFIFGLGLPLSFFFLASAIQGASGGFALFIVLCFSYVADNTTKKSRMFRIVIIDMIFLLGAGISQIGVGYFLKAAGYVAPMLMAECFAVLTFFYVITPTFIPEKTPEKRGAENQDDLTVSKRRPKGEVFKHIAELFKVNTNHRRRILVSSCVIMFFFAPVSTSQLQIIGLYGLGEPFCWGSVTLGYFMAVDLLVLAIGKYIKTYLHTCLSIIPFPSLAACCQDG